MILVRAAVALALLALLGCGGEGILGVLPEANTPEGVRFEVKDTVLSHGDTVMLVLTNSSDREIGYNLCVADLELRDGTGWRQVQKLPSNTGCILPLYRLAPGESAEYTQPIYDFIASGTYRFRDDIEWMDDGSRVEVISNGFRVR